MNKDDVIALLRKAVERAGTQLEWARKHDYSPAYISDVLSGRRDPSERILRTLGLRKSYERIPKANGAERKET